MAFAATDTQQPEKGITASEYHSVLTLGNALAEQAGGIWLLISGRFTSGNGGLGTEGQVRELMRTAFGHPKADSPELTVNLLLDSTGGSLDSAYTTVLYLSAYAKILNVYVPDRARSASTLLAVGADRVFLSEFGALGPLDTQIPDPRNPANTVSALDCYRSVDYVRDFGFTTTTLALLKLVDSTERLVPVDELLAAASTFALGSINPMLQSVTALDFGGWGRSLRIGEQYALKLLQRKMLNSDRTEIEYIANQLVYGYTHHLFPIDLSEARRLRLNVEPMDKEIYAGAIKVVEACHRKSHVDFLSKEQCDAVAEARKEARVDVAHAEQEAGETQAT